MQLIVAEEMKQKPTTDKKNWSRKKAKKPKKRGGRCDLFLLGEFPQSFLVDVDIHQVSLLVAVS